MKRRGDKSEEECIMATFPLDKQGYIDDSLCPTCDLFMDLFFDELWAYCQPKGILISWPKCMKADAFGRKWTMEADVGSSNGFSWGAPVRGCLVPLGKYLVMTLTEGIVKERPDRIHHLITDTLVFVATAMAQAGQFVAFDDFESLIGKWLYVAQTCLAIVPLLQFPLRNLHTRFRHKATRLRTLGAVIPLLSRSMKALELICEVAKANRGVAFAADESDIDYDTAIWVVHDAAGYSIEEPDSYRGHFTIIIIPGCVEVCYVEGKWSAAELLNNSTTLEAGGGNAGLGPALVKPSPKRRKIVTSGGNIGLGKALSKFTKGDVIECYDSKSTTGAFLRAGCRSVPLSAQCQRRGTIWTELGYGRRLFILWFPRELNTICDAGSKGNITLVKHLLRERGLPPLAPEPELPTHPPLFGPLHGLAFASEQ
jgi:hypothetical protein